jgi:hypothetical protein
MRNMTGTHLGASVVALALGLVLTGVVSAQETVQSPGLVIGQVARCVNGNETPAAGIAVGVEGGGANLAQTDSTGAFLLALPPGSYTIVIVAEGGANRQYVPVEPGTVLDIGILDLGGGLAGCGPDEIVTAPVVPTFTPTAVPVEVVPTATPLPTATPVPTPVPAPAVEEPAPVEEPAAEEAG